MSPTFAERIATLEEKAESCEFSREDHEKRIRGIEITIWRANGAVALVLVVVQIILKFV